LDHISIESIKHLIEFPLHLNIIENISI